MYKGCRAKGAGKKGGERLRDHQEVCLSGLFGAYSLLDLFCRLLLVLVAEVCTKGGSGGLQRSVSGDARSPA